jgi:hypothetical protein
MSTIAPLDCIGVGIDTARYGHRVSFLRPDRTQAAKPLTVMENRAGYESLQERLNQLHEQHPDVHFQFASTPPASTPRTSKRSSAALSCP